MKSRPAYDLKEVIKVYNLIQIFTNLYIGINVSLSQSKYIHLRGCGHRIYSYILVLYSLFFCALHSVE